MALVRATSFDVCVVYALNGPRILVLGTMLAIRLSMAGQSFRQAESRLEGWSVGWTNKRMVEQVALLGKVFPFYGLILEGLLPAAKANASGLFCAEVCRTRKQIPKLTIH